MTPFYNEKYDENLLFSELRSCRKIRMMRDGSRALILGYEIHLTASEYTILHALSKSDLPISRKSFAENYGLTYSSIPVHVANINKKAFPITGRKLILGNKCYDYQISETM